MKYAFLLMIVFISWSCSEKGAPTLSERTHSLLSADPELDVQAAIVKKDHRFKGVYGYSISTLGISIMCLDYEKDIAPIEGTSDSMDSYEDEIFNAVARVYAENYNLKMKIYLEENYGVECGS